MQICPNAETDDGWLDVCLVGDLSAARRAARAARDLPGEAPVKHPKVEIVHARDGADRGGGATRVHLDGEPFGMLPVEITAPARRRSASRSPTAC